MKSPEKFEQPIDYESVREELAVFLPDVGEKILALRKAAEHSPDFAERKADGSLVTKADLLAELLIRKWIEARFPEHAIRGEEGKDKKGAGHTWIIDPIDGTHPFLHEGKGFGISVGLVAENEPKAGVLFFPAEKVTVSASAGKGALLNGAPFRLEPGKKEFTDAVVLTDLPDNPADVRFVKTGRQVAHLLGRMRYDSMRRSYTFAFLRFLRGEGENLIHFGATPYDIGAAAAIAKELELPVSGFNGEPIDFSGKIIPIVISKDKKFHNALIRELASAG